MEASRHLEDRLREVALEEQRAQAWTQVAESPARHSAITLVKQDGLRVVLLAMAAGSELPGLAHDLLALEETELLLTLGFRG